MANELHGKGTAEAKQWIKPLLKQMNEGEALKVIEALQELIEAVKDNAKTKGNLPRWLLFLCRAPFGWWLASTAIGQD